MANALDFVLSTESVQKASKRYGGARAALGGKLNLVEPE